MACLLCAAYTFISFENSSYLNCIACYETLTKTDEQINHDVNLTKVLCYELSINFFKTIIAASEPVVHICKS